MDARATMYRGPQAAKLAGISFRQLDYWATTGLVTPVRESAGPGTQRGYDFEGVLRLRIVKELNDLGVSIQRIRLVLEAADDSPLVECEAIVGFGNTAVVCPTMEQAAKILLAHGAGWVIRPARLVEELERAA